VARRASNPIGRERRKAVAARPLGEHGVCVACGEDRPAALITGRLPRLCARCARIRQGKRTVDQHHPAGRANHPLTIPVGVNSHRAELSEDQHDWPRSTLENTNGDPLLARAACVRGYISTATYLMEILEWPEFLEALSDALTKRHGRLWWKKLGLSVPRWPPRSKS
jgi:hypothetical protein